MLLEGCLPEPAYRDWGSNPRPPCPAAAVRGSCAAGGGGGSWQRAAIRTPGPISTLTVMAGGTGILIATWSHAIRADRYRVFKQIIGTDLAPVQVASDVEGLTFTLLGLPSGETVQVYIVPANATGDGPASPTVSTSVP